MSSRHDKKGKDKKIDDGEEKEEGYIEVLNI
jgi:hypothetical protein